MPSHNASILAVAITLQGISAFAQDGTGGGDLRDTVSIFTPPATPGGGKSTIVEVKAGPEQGIRADALASELVARPEVQRELALTEDQVSELKRLDALHLRKREELLRRLREGGVGRLRSNPNWSEYSEYIKECETSIFNVLGPKRSRRLREIMVQNAGPRAFLRPDVANLLELDEDQFAFIKRVIGQPVAPERVGAKKSHTPGEEKAVRFDAAAFRETLGSDEYRALMEARRADARRRDEAALRSILEVLSPWQRAAYRQLAGKPFDISKIRSPLKAKEAPDPRSAARADGGKDGSGARPQRGDNADDRTRSASSRN